MTHLHFASRVDFRAWLENNYASSEGVWLLFSKTSPSIKASEALEEALCFGWIDGQMKSLGDEGYIKYFAARRKNSKWSDKNKKLVEKLEQQGLMTEHGRAKIDEAKQNGQWDAQKANAVGDDKVALVSELLKGYEPAYSNYCAMSPSVKKTYARAYFDARTEATRVKRLSWMVERLNKNLKPM